MRKPNANAIQRLAKLFGATIESTTRLYEALIMEAIKQGASDEQAKQHAVDSLPYALQNN